MALNLSGPISLNGSTVGQSIGLELGKSSTAMVSLNDSDIRTLAGVLTGAISMSAFYGKSAAPAIGEGWTTNTFDVWLRAVENTGSGFIAVGDLGKIITSPDGITWTERASGTSNHLYGAWRDSVSGLTIVVGNNGTILTSSDLVTWTARTSGVAVALRGVVRSGSTWVAVGDTATVLTSSDGSSWAAQTSGQPYSINSVTWTGLQFVACGNNRYIISSPDGITWTTRLTGTSGALYAVRWAANLLIAVGNIGTILTSPDPISWTSRTSGTSADTFYGIMRGPNYWVVVGSGGIRFSTTGTTWSFHTNPGVTLSGAVFNPTLATYITVGSSHYISTSTAGNTSYTERKRTFDIYDLTYSPSLNRYVACGSQGRVQYSSDAINWLVGTSSVATGNTLSNIVWNGSIFAAVTTTTTAPVITSTTGISFTSRTTPAAIALNSIAWDPNNSRFIAGGTGGYLTKSSTGTTWTDLAMISSTNDMIYVSSLGLYVAVGNSGGIWTSTDSIKWTPRMTVAGNALTGIAWNGSILVAVGAGGTIRTSTDAITWTSVVGGSNLTGVVWTGSQFVAVGSTGTIRTSQSGSIWSTQTSGTSANFSSVAVGGSTIIACGTSGLVRSSTDGITWTSRTFGTTTSINKVIYSGSSFVALAGTTCRYSSDGTTWSTGAAPGISGLVSCVAHNGTVVAIGTNTGTIRTSTNSGLNWASPTIPTTQALGSMCWDGSKFVVGATGSNQIIHSNSNSTTWTVVVNGNAIRAITANGSGYHVMVGDQGLIQTASAADITNNVIPTIRNIGGSIVFNGVTWTGSQFLTVGQTGTIWTSPDGNTWTPRTSGTAVELTGVKWVGTQFIVSGSSGTILTSPDGITWATKPSNTTYNLRNIEYHNNRAFAMGNFGIVLQSGP
jgi:hypothetical protein